MFGTYSQPSIFRRDACLARTRVLNIGYSPPLSSDEPIPPDAVYLANESFVLHRAEQHQI